MKHAWSVLKQQLNPIALWQLIRYGIVGVTTNILGYGVFLLVTSFGVDPKSTMSSFYVLGAVLGFFGNKKLTFSHTGNLYGSIFRYIIAHTIGFTLNFMLLTVFYEWYGATTAPRFSELVTSAINAWCVSPVVAMPTPKINNSAKPNT